jgi:hypothetical protein
MLLLVRLREGLDFDLFREPDQGNLHVRFDERVAETEHGMRF